MENIAVFFGGKSTEHDISIISASMAIKVLKNEFNVLPIYITKDNKFYTGDFSDLKVFKNFDYNKFKELIFIKNKAYILRKNKLKFYCNVDVAIPIMHGKNGEDGTLQGFLELKEIPYTSSKVLGSAICMNKFITKQILKQNKVNVVDAILITKNEEDKLNKFIKKTGFPVIVKPVNLGSSIGITLVKNENDLKDAIDFAFTFDDKILIEKALDNFKEYNISVLKVGEDILTSVIEEPLGKDEILSFQDKYKSKTGKGMESLNRIFPNDLSVNIVDKIQKFAQVAYKECECFGVVRIDFLVKDEKVYLNEINAIPGSMAYYLWKEKYSYLDLLKVLILEAKKDFAKKSRLNTVFDGSVL